jgi:magnesium transporter
MVVEARQQQLLDEVRALVESGETRKALSLLASRHPADQADVIEELGEALREPLLRSFSPEETAEILEHLADEPRARLVRGLDPAFLGPVLDHVHEDVAADILQALDREQAEAVLARMREPERVRGLLAHEEETAGGRMSPAVVALHKGWTVDEAIAYLRSQKPDVDYPYYLYVVDADHRLEGIVSMRQLIVSDPGTKLGDIMDRDVISVSAGADQEVAAEKMRHYDLMALPVVDDDGRLVGVITADDVLDVQVEEATEDIYRQAGLDVQETVLSPVGTALRRRVPWLLVNLMTAFVAALTVSAFEGTISRVAMLAAFMPIIAGHGGNTGTQATTLVVRGLALGEVGVRDAARVAAKEIAFGFVHGLLAGLLTAGLALILSQNVWLALVVLVAMVGNLVVAGLAGALIPLGLKAIRIDPALASAIWLTTFTDVMGFLFLLGMGTLLVDRLA